MENRTKRKRKKVGRGSGIEKKDSKKIHEDCPQGPTNLFKRKKKGKRKEGKGGKRKKELRTRIKRIIYQERVKRFLIMK